MLFKLDTTNPKQTKKLTITNIYYSPILIRILENNAFRFFPTFSMLRINEQKSFQIMPKEVDKDLSDIKIEAIVYDENKLETFSAPPFWKEKVNGSLLQQSYCIPGNQNILRSSSFASYEVLPAMNQTFQEQKIAYNSLNENSIKIEQLQLKHSATNDSEQLNSKQKFNSQSSLQLSNPLKTLEDSRQFFGSNQIKNKTSNTSLPPISFSANSPKIQIPAEMNQFLDQIDSSASPFQIQSVSPSHSQSQRLITNENGNENGDGNISLSETTSIQRQHRMSSIQILQQSKSAQNDLPKLRVSQTFIGNPKSIIENQQQFEKIKEKESQIQKQISELKAYKTTLEKELEQLEFKALFNSKNKQSSYNHNIYIWHMLLTCVICLIIGSALKKIIQVF